MYGTYIKISKKKLEEFASKEQIAKEMIVQAEVVHKALEKTLYKFKLKEGKMPKVLKTI